MHKYLYKRVATLLIAVFLLLPVVAELSHHHTSPRATELSAIAQPTENDNFLSPGYRDPACLACFFFLTTFAPETNYCILKPYRSADLAALQYGAMIRFSEPAPYQLRAPPQSMSNLYFTVGFCE